MVDVVDKHTRSRMMSGIRGTNTRPERLIRSLLHKEGFRFRLHRRDLPGRPDIVLSGLRAVIFVNGCFWHGHSCSLFKWPTSRPKFWKQKIDSNRRRDRKVRLALRMDGWRVAVVWECAVKGRLRRDARELVRTLSAWLRSADNRGLEIRERAGDGDRGGRGTA